MDEINLMIGFWPVLLTLGSLVTSWIGRHEQNVANARAQNNAQEFEKAMIAQQNEYNSPAAQMKRFTDAGLNPNLMYGTGSVGGGNQSSTPRAHVPTIENELKNLDLTQFLGVMSQYQNYNIQREQIDNIRANREYIEAKTFNERLKIPLFGLDKDTREFNLGQAKRLSNTQVDINKAELEKLRAGNKRMLWQLENLDPARLNLLKQEYSEVNPTKIALMNAEKGLIPIRGSLLKKDIQLKQLQYEYESTLRRFNANNNDELWVRFGAKLYDSLFGDDGSFRDSTGWKRPKFFQKADTLFNELENYRANDPNF